MRYVRYDQATGKIAPQQEYHMLRARAVRVIRLKIGCTPYPGNLGLLCCVADAAFLCVIRCKTRGVRHIPWHRARSKYHSRSVQRRVSTDIVHRYEEPASQRRCTSLDGYVRTFLKSMKKRNGPYISADSDASLDSVSKIAVANKKAKMLVERGKLRRAKSPPHHKGNSIHQENSAHGPSCLCVLIENSTQTYW